MPLPDAVITEFHNMEEKGSDVNLAAHLVKDAWRGLFESAVVISNDTDLVSRLHGFRVHGRDPFAWPRRGAEKKLRSRERSATHERKSRLCG